MKSAIYVDHPPFSYMVCTRLSQVNQSVLKSPSDLEV